MADKYAPRLKAVYDETIAKAMVEKFGYKHVMEVPRIEKIVLNMGVGEATQDKKKVTSAAEEMELIAGQKPEIGRAHVCTPVTNAHIVCRLLLDKKNIIQNADRDTT